MLISGSSAVGVGVEKVIFSAEIVRADDGSDSWIVEAIDAKTGDIYSARFYNMNARERAERYAADTFASYAFIDEA